MPWRFVEGHEEHISAETITKVLVDADLWSYIQQMGGLLSPMQDTKLAEDQQVWFSLARSIFHCLQNRNKVVIMDNPIANLDDEGRQKATKLISKYLSTSTILTFCQDVRSIGEVDVVHWLWNGRIGSSRTARGERSKR